jgi:GT2 family glycosyltransferase
MNDYPAVDIVTVMYNSERDISAFADSVRALQYPRNNVTVWVVDNNSTDGSVAAMKAADVGFEKKIIVNTANLGFARANNRIFAQSSAPFIALLNVDTKVDPGWLAQLVKAAGERPQAGMFASKQMPREANRAIDENSHEVSWCSGGHCLIRRQALERVGCFEEKLFMYGEDVDLSWRMWLAGFTCAYVAGAVCFHHEQGHETFKQRRAYYHVRNSILLRYKYGRPIDIRRVIAKWVTEAVFLMAKPGRFTEGFAVARAVVAHVFFAPYFRSQYRRLTTIKEFPQVYRKWITF